MQSLQPFLGISHGLSPIGHIIPWRRARELPQLVFVIPDPFLKLFPEANSNNATQFVYDGG